jgi:hypothetical protein
MEDAGLEAGGGEGALHEAMIAAGAFASDQAVLELVSGERLPDLGDGVVEVRSVVGDGGRGDEDVAVEISEEELGAGLGTVEADNAEVVRADLLNAGMQDAARLAHAVVRAPRGRAFASPRSSHRTCLREEGWASSHFPRWQSGESFIQ